MRRRKFEQCDIHSDRLSSPPGTLCCRNYGNNGRKVSGLHGGLFNRNTCPTETQPTVSSALCTWLSWSSSCICRWYLLLSKLSSARTPSFSCLSRCTRLTSCSLSCSWFSRWDTRRCCWRPVQWRLCPWDTNERTTTEQQRYLAKHTSAASTVWDSAAWFVAVELYVNSEANGLPPRIYHDRCAFRRFEIVLPPLLNSSPRCNVRTTLDEFTSG